VTASMRVLLCMVFGVLAAASNAQAGGAPSDFSIVVGSDIPVCRAFRDVLNTMEVDQAPHCNIRELSPAPGFATLMRKRLSTDELYAIAEPLIGFAEHNDPKYFDARRASVAERCLNQGQIEPCKSILAKKKAAEDRGSRWPETYGKDFFRTSHAWSKEFNGCS
jgi:hypothetical protein